MILNSDGPQKIRQGNALPQFSAKGGGAGLITGERGPCRTFFSVDFPTAAAEKITPPMRNKTGDVPRRIAKEKTDFVGKIFFPSQALRSMGELRPQRRRLGITVPGQDMNCLWGV